MYPISGSLALATVIAPSAASFNVANSPSPSSVPRFFVPAMVSLVRPVNLYKLALVSFPTAVAIPILK